MSLISYNILKDRHNFKPKGVLHVGGHNFHEYDEYKTIGIQHGIVFEPQKQLIDEAKQKCNNDKNFIFKNIALGNEVKDNFDFWMDHNNGGSSSLLKPKEHLNLHPSIQFSKVKKEIKLSTLDIEVEKKDKYDFLNIDVQGFELEVLKGGTETLKYIKYIILEVNMVEVYESCPLLNDIDIFLKDFNFNRKEISLWNNAWGDAFYIKETS